LILCPILFFGLLEAGLRLGGYGYPTGFFIGPDANGTCTTNDRFGWRFFPRSLNRDPHPCVLSAKPAGSVRIFVLGSSAAMGTPDPSFSFGRILEVMLRQQYPGTQFEVVNGAMTAINSYAALEIARDCAAREPDLFVVYMGNNEVTGPYGPGTVFQQWSPNLRMVRASLWAKSTRVGQLLGDVAGCFRGNEGTPDHWRGMEMFLNNPVTADDPRLPAVYDNYRRNLTDICGIARRARAAVVLSTVAVNLRDCPPFASLHRSDLTAEDLAKWQLMYKAGGELEASNRWLEAVERYEVAAKIDDRFAELHFRIGQCLMLAGRVAEARARFESARDLDVLRFRADSRTNAIIRDVAGEQKGAGVRFADAERALAQSDPDSKGISGGDLFYEHVHLTFAGNYLLARSVLDQVRDALGQLAALSKPGAIPSRQQCAELLALTPWDDYQLAADMVEMTSKAPFTNQLNHSFRQAVARQRMDGLRRAASTPQAMQASWRTYEAALAKTPDDWLLHHHFGRLAMQWGQPDVAVEHLRIAVKSVPWHASIYSNLGNALAAQGQVDEAIAHFQKALKINPDDEIAHYNLANVLAGRKQVDEAIAHYQKALEIKPDYQVAHFNLANVLAGRGQADEAIAHYRKALEIEPDDAQAHSNLGVVLAGRGQIDDAIAHFQKALEINPNDVKVRRNLEAARRSKK
jgi:tetratricopeptide (TPR) repeat protein